MLEKEREKWLQGRSLQVALESMKWSDEDLNLFLHIPYALKSFAQQQFGPGLEEDFLSSQGSKDRIVYSLIRVRDSSLARELWIRLEEGEMTFAEAASSFSEGPEAARKGVMGPMQIGTLEPPELVNCLRNLLPGQISPPWILGEWNILLRLEQLTPARFDQDMRNSLLHEHLDRFLQERVESLLNGATLNPLHFDVD